VIELASASLRVVVDADHGGQIVFVGRPGGRNTLFHDDWQSPTPADESTHYGSDSLDWLSRYRGGWQVMFPNAGAECTADGITHPVHGEVTAVPAEVVQASGDVVLLRSTTRLGLRLDRRISITAGRPALLVEETVLNDSDRTVSYVWGHHPAIAATPGTLIDLPAGPVHVDDAFEDPDADLEPGAVSTWPYTILCDGRGTSLARVPAGPVERVCSLPDRPEGWAAVRDPGIGRGVGLAWDLEAFPHLWLWEQMNGGRFPFHARAQLVGIEPVSCWPGDGLARAIERGQARTIGPKETVTGWVTMALFDATDDAVIGVDAAGRVFTTGSTTGDER
jgi:hypothetical protein